MNKFSDLDRINYVNIGWMAVSCIMAILCPFELFLFSYAVLGPLHYLTEISWLHDKSYFTKGKYDYWLLGGLTVLITLPFLGPLLGLGKFFDPAVNNRLIYFSVGASIVFVFLKNNFFRILGLALILLTTAVSDKFYLLFSVFLPTLLHVYVFTALFMLYGSMKSKSKSGYLSTLVMVLCPVILLNVFPQAAVPVSDYVRHSYKSFEPMNFYTLKHFFNMNITPQNYHDTIYFSGNGGMLMRFIAFAYTYHYLNWFSKTEVIKWHLVPGSRLLAIAFLWIISLVLYAYDYTLGFNCLFFLSFLHVVLELPLNIFSLKGIFLELKQLRPV